VNGSDISDPFDHFFGFLSRAEANKASSNSTLSHMRQNGLNLELRERYEILKAHAQHQDPWLRDFLMSQSFQTRQGHNWSTDDVYGSKFGQFLRDIIPPDSFEQRPIHL
jgi:hypothetical protein